MKIILAVILITVGIVFWFAPSAEDYKNISYEIDGELVVLANGKSETGAIPESASKIITQYFGKELKKDFNNDGAEDIAFILVQGGGGTGIFYYLAVALKMNSGYVGTNAVFIGDRVIPQAVEFKDRKITVKYLDRKQNEPFTVIPSITHSKSMMLEGGRLVDVK